MTAVILAGGKGTRLREITAEVPKPLVPVLGKPVLEYQIECLKRSGVNDIVLVVGHLGDQIEDYFGDGSRFGVRIRYFVETTPLGTAGSFAHLRDTLPETFFVVYGDALLDIDFERFGAFHAAHDGTASLLVHPNDHPADSDIVDMDAQGVVRGILRKNVPREQWYHNCVNAGVFVFDRVLFDDVEAGTSVDLEKDVILPAIGRGLVHGYLTTEYVKDMGTPERYHRVTEHVRTGVVAAKCLRNKQKAVFIDRDGTINRHSGLVSHPDQLEVLPEAFDALAALNSSEYLSILVTNQPVVARGLCSVDELDVIHRKLETVLGERHVYLDDIYFCPHHPDKGYPEENPAYKIPCSCRKPATGLIEQAAATYNIDLAQSYFVGDTTVDVQTGLNAGVRTILLATGEAGSDGKHDVSPDFEADDLLAATKIILA